MKPARSVEGQIMKGLPCQAKEVNLHPKDDWKLLKAGDRTRSVFYVSKTAAGHCSWRKEHSRQQGVLLSPNTSENGQPPM